MTVFNKFARSFKSHWLLYLCVIVFGITNLVASSGAHMVQRLLFFVLTILVVKRISSLPLRLLVAAPFVLLTAADMSISLYSWCTFGTTFNDGFAISVLQSDPDEVVKMLGMYIPYLCAFAFLSLLFLSVIIKYDVSLPGVFLFLIILLPCGHWVSPSGEVWDACAARGKAGPVMGLRPLRGPPCIPPEAPPRRFSASVRLRGHASCAAGASLTRCARSGDLPPRRVMP